MSNVAFLTVIYPAMRPFLVDFLTSLQRQNIRQFDLVICNDGLHGFDFSGFDLNIHLLECSGTPAAIREQGIKWLVERGYEIAIFGDSDDYFDNRRVESTLTLLERYDLVVNDVSLVDQEGNMLLENYFSHRISHLEEIDCDYIADRNIFGLSNTAARLSAWKKIDCPEQLVAADWYLFSRAMLDGARAVFNAENVTYYRQHGANTVGLMEQTPEKVLADLRCKMLHYEALCLTVPARCQIGGAFRVLYEDVAHNEQNQQHYFEYIVNRKIEFPFWWEEIVLPEEYL